MRHRAPDKGHAAAAFDERIKLPGEHNAPESCQRLFARPAPAKTRANWPALTGQHTSIYVFGNGRPFIVSPSTSATLYLCVGFRLLAAAAAAATGKK